jgi:hypothetical protein
MTLKEKFDVISCKDCDMPFCDIKCTMLSDWELDKLEQTADEYAIEFAYWCEWRNDKAFKTYEELLEIYKKEKGL